MAGHLSAERVERYHQGKLGSTELLLVGDHLAVCPSCRELLSGADSLPKTFGAFKKELDAEAYKDSPHLAAELMAAYLDNELGEADRITADRHIDNCAECHTEMLELRQLKPTLFDSQSSSRPSTPAATRSNTIIDLLRPRAHWLPMVGAALIVLAFLFLALIPMRRQMSQLNAQLSELQKNNEELQDRISALTGAQAGPNGEGDAPADNLNTGDPVVLSLNDGGGVVSLDQQGRLTGLKPLSPDYEKMLINALTSQGVKRSRQLADLTGKRELLMGGNAGREGFFLKGPIGTAIESNRPTFRWSAMSGATGYVVTVQNTRSKEVISSDRISGTEWTPDKPLERGDLYAWEVTATRDGEEVTVPVPPLPQARFIVLDRAKLDELARARQSYPSSHLLLGLLYAQAGMQDEATKEFEALVAGNPDSLTARKLLRSVKTSGNQ